MAPLRQAPHQHRSPSKSNVNGRKEFLKAAEELEYESIYSKALEDDGESWVDRVCLRFLRVFLPQLTVKQARDRPERFFGHVAAYVAQLIEKARKAKVSEIPRTKFGRV